MPNFLKNRWLVMAVVVAAVSLLGYRFIIGPRLNPQKETSHIIKREDLQEILPLSGKIDASQKATLRFQTSGYLAWVGVKEGDAVKKFQTVASLDQEELQKNLKKYLNTYMSERWDFEVDKKNYESRITNDLKIILDKAQFDLNNAVIDVEIKNLAVKYANLWTPIDGTVTAAKSPVAGVNITPTQAEFEIINPATVYFSVTADQADVVKLAEGLTGTIRLDSFADEEITGRITKISFIPKTDETGTVYEVQIALPANPNRPLRLGMTGDADFVIREVSDTLAAPTKFIRSNPDGTRYVWVKDKNDKKAKQVITLGDVFENQTEIKSGLTEGTRIYEN